MAAWPSVFLARDTRTGAQVALKLVREGTDHEAQEILEAEQRGALLQKQFSAISTRVPQVYESGFGGDYFYVAMEYLEGENLSDAIARGPMPVEQRADDCHRAVPLRRGRAFVRAGRRRSRRCDRCCTAT